jgi:hypothetical protein
MYLKYRTILGSVKLIIRMRFLSIIVFMTLIAEIAFSQQWNCFPPYQKSYYQFESDNITSIDMTVQDSTVINGPQEKLYFKSKIPFGDDTSCINIVRNFYFYYPHFYNNHVTPDSLWRVNDTIYYSSQIYFLPCAIAGQVWTLNTTPTISFTCDSIVSEVVFGVTDSIKYFHISGVINGQIFRLSKQFGFLEFIAFCDLLNPVSFRKLYLIGIEDTVSQHGFYSPTFHDYFPYQVGDLLKWDYFFDNTSTWTFSYHNTFYDSITQVLNFPDSVVISYDRIQVDASYQVWHYAESRTFRRYEFGYLLESPPCDLGMSIRDIYNKWLYNTSYIQMTPDTVLSDTSVTRHFYWSHSYMDINCEIDQMVDGFNPEYTFNTNLGLTQELYDWYNSRNIFTLISARIGGNRYGDPNFYVGVESINLSKTKLYPNPTNGYITLDFPQIISVEISIYDMYG